MTIHTNRLLRRVALTALFVVFPLGLHAAPIEQARLDAIAADLQARVDEGKLAGVVAMVAKDGVVQMEQSFGYRDLENKVPMTNDSIFRIFSMTKPVAGTALMMLYDEGKFQLEDPVEKYLPEFKGMQVFKAQKPDGSFETEPANHPMTIRELMSHTGGLVYTAGLSRGPIAEAYGKAGILDPARLNLQEMAKALSSIPLNHQPGSQWVYSISVDVQGYLVEVLSGKSLDVFLQERIFNPLGMNDTLFYVTPEKASRFVRRYRPVDGKLTSPENKDFLEKPRFLSGGGGLTSTASDYMKFAMLHLNKGVVNGKRLLSEKAIMIMRTNQLPEGIANIGAFYPGNQFGVDFAIVNDSVKADGMPVGTHWWWGIAGSWFWIDPVQNVVFIGMINHDDLMYARQVHSKTRNLIYNPL